MICSNKQLLNEVEHYIKNYQGQSLCYPPKLKAEYNSRHHAKTESNILLCIQNKETKKNANENTNIRNGTHEQCPLHAKMFLKQLNDISQSFKLMKINFN